MYDVSDAFLTAVQGASHQATYKAEVLVGGQVVRTIENRLDESGERVTYGVAGGSITVDSTATIWRSGHVKFADESGELIPNTSTDLLTPYGNEIRVYRGVMVDGEAENVPLITGGITNVQVDETPGGFVIDCDIYDRSALVQKAKWSTVYNVAAGTNVITAILAILQDRLPGALWAYMVPSYTATVETSPNLVLGGQGSGDPWADIQSLAASIGLIVYFDPLGNPVIRAQPDPANQNQVAWSVAEGENLTGVKRRITSDETYNGVTVNGENSTPGGALYSYTAWDTDTSSPTYYLGPFGKRPAPAYTDPKANSTAACQASAQARLLTMLGLSNIVSTASIVNPALEALDIVTVTRDRIGISGVPHIASGFTVPLDVSTTMDLAYRKRQ